MALRARFQEYVEEGLSGRAAAARLKLSAATGVRWLRKMREQGNVAPAAQGRPPGYGKLAPYRSFLEELVGQDGDITLPELAGAMKNPQLYALAGARQLDKHGVVGVGNQYQLVMLADRPLESLVLLRRTVCWDREELLYLDPGPPLPPPVAEALAAKIRAFNADDTLLYAHFSKGMDALIESMLYWLSNTNLGTGARGKGRWRQRRRKGRKGRARGGTRGTVKRGACRYARTRSGHTFLIIRRNNRVGTSRRIQ